MILGICGYARVGKDTLCERLENFHRLAFADALKMQVTQMLKAAGIEADLWGADKEEWRDLLVFWGRKMRARDKDYWIKQLYLRHAAALLEDRVCITDCRYLNECRWITDKGGLIIGIGRPGYGPANEEEAMTIREIRIQRPDICWINNDGTPQDLATQARQIIKEFNCRQIKGSVLY